MICLKDGDLVGVTKNISIMQFTFVQSYIYTFPADDLKEQAEVLQRAVYSSQWFKMPPYIKKDVVFMMMRINLPSYYTVGKYFYLTRQSYMIIIKTAMSYLSVLRVMIK